MQFLIPFRYAPFHQELPCFQTTKRFFTVLDMGYTSEIAGIYIVEIYPMSFLIEVHQNSYHFYLYANANQMSATHNHNRI